MLATPDVGSPNAIERQRAARLLEPKGARQLIKESHGAGREDLLKILDRGPHQTVPSTRPIAARARADNLTRETRMARDDLYSQPSRLPRRTPPAISGLRFSDACRPPLGWG